MFKITGLIENNTKTLTWDNGILSGDKIALEKAILEDKKDHGSLGMVPSTTKKDYLLYETSAYHLIFQFVFDSILSQENNWTPYDDEGDY